MHLRYRFLGVLVVGLTVATHACGGDGAGPGNGNGNGTPDTTPASIAITGADDVELAGTEQLSAAASNAAGQPVTATISWSSSDTLVATVDATGLVTGLALGPVTITAATADASGTIADDHNLTVRIASIVVTASADTMTSIGDTVTLAAEARDALGGVVSGISFTYSSSDSAIVTVDTAGVAVAIAAGVATISVEADTRTGTADLVVRQTAVSLSLPAGPPDTLVSFGDTRAFTATALDARGNAIGAGFTWTSSNSTVATLDGSTGNQTVATSLSNGSTTIMVERDGFTGQAVVVVDQRVASVSITTASVTVFAALTVQLGASAVDGNGNPVSGQPVMWNSNDTAIATVDGTGLVTGVDAGTIGIVAAAGGLADTASVTVVVVSFAADVQLVFSNSCALSGCHAGSTPVQGMNLSSGQAFSNIVNVAANESPLLRIKRFEPDSSYLIHKIQGTQASEGGGSGAQMPFGMAPLSQETIDMLRAWVKAGAQNN